MTDQPIDLAQVRADRQKQQAARAREQMSPTTLNRRARFTASALSGLLACPDVSAALAAAAPGSPELARVIDTVGDLAARLGIAMTERVAEND